MYVWPNGEPFDEDRRLLLPAPPEIGSVQFASTTLTKSNEWTKALSWIGMTFRHTTGYIGSLGIACFECDRKPDRLTRRETLLYAEASSLFKRRTSTSFEFLWKDHLDRLIFRYEDNLPAVIPPDHIVHMLDAAESIWIHRFLDIASGNLERGGGVDFTILGRGVLRIGPSSITFDSLEFERSDFEFFRRTTDSIEIHPSYKGEARGFRTWQAKTHTVSNVEALHQLLVHALQLPLRD